MRMINMSTFEFVVMSGHLLYDKRGHVSVQIKVLWGDLTS
jgi:hypothetical protein